MNYRCFYVKSFIILSIFSIFFIGCYYFYFYLHSPCKDKNVTIEYLNYDHDRDVIDLEKVIEKYKFWLFHDGVCTLYPNFKSMLYPNDFKSSVNIPYYMKVVLIDGHCMGFLTYYISENLLAKGDEVKKLGRIHLLCVDEQYRRLGIAKKLISDVMGFFREQGCQKVYLTARPENIRAKNLYYKFGFTELDRSSYPVNIFDANPADILVKDII